VRYNNDCEKKTFSVVFQQNILIESFSSNDLVLFFIRILLRSVFMNDKGLVLPQLVMYGRSSLGLAIPSNFMSSIRHLIEKELFDLMN
jgi:hypothetical protein